MIFGLTFSFTILLLILTIIFTGLSTHFII